MKCILDLHIHSRFARACSKDLTLPNLAAWADRKGIDIVGTGDILHPVWREEVRAAVTEEGSGCFRLNESDAKARFFLTTEVSSIYKDGAKVRRVHTLFFFPSFASVDAFAAALEARGCNIRSDGRPIVGIPCRELLHIARAIDEKILVVPAHAWTPWFAIFGSESGYDSLAECFGEDAKYIYAIETGLSSDPLMNWQLSALDSIFLISNSDAHSLPNLGREANVMDLAEKSYPAFEEILRTHDTKRFLETIEFFPEEGKYHADGHRECGVRLLPTETDQCHGKCRICGKQVTVGVLHRVHALADRAHGFRPENTPGYRHLIPLEEIIAESLGVKKGSKKVRAEYVQLTDTIAPEFPLLLDFPLEMLKDRVSPELLEALRRVRSGEVKVMPGYDGEYGTIQIFSSEEKMKKNTTQEKLF